MQDPWKYLAFPAAAVAGYILAMTQLAVFVGNTVGLDQYVSEILVVAVSGFLAGFLIDEVIPAYLQNVRSGSKNGMDEGLKGDMGGGNDDFDFE